MGLAEKWNWQYGWITMEYKYNQLRQIWTIWTMVGEMNEMDCVLKEIKMKHHQWSVDWRKWNETWTVKCGLKETRWNMNNEVDNVTLGNTLSNPCVTDGCWFSFISRFVMTIKSINNCTISFGAFSLLISLE